MENFLRTHLGEVKKSGTGEWRVNSPFTSDKKFHLYIEPNKGLVFDFKSGFKGTVVSFVAEVLQITKQEVIPILFREYGVAGIVVPEKIEDLIEKDEGLVLPAGLHFFTENNVSPIRDQAYNYLVERQIPEENIKELGYIYDPGSEFDRTIFIPFYENGRIVYFVARDFTGKANKRYTNPHGINTKQFLYNYDRIDDRVFIFEGVMDALSLRGQVGTAMFSADLGRDQAIKIFHRGVSTVCFIPDNDETGRKTLDKNIRTLISFKPPSVNLKIYIYRVKGAKDFNESGEHYIFLQTCEEYKPNDIQQINPKRSTLI